MVRRYALRHDQRARLKGLLPGRVGYVGGTAADNRRVVGAVLYRYRAGIAWPDALWAMPERFGKWKSVHQRFDRWAKGGIWERVFAALSADADNEYAMLNSTIVRAHQHSADVHKGGTGDEAIDRGRGGLNTKIHALVDALGNPTAFYLSGGQAHDLAGADALLAGIVAPTLIADRSYDAEARVLRPLREADEVAVIPPGRGRNVRRDYDRDRYATRHLAENFFCRLKQSRSIATRYDTIRRNFLAGVYAAATAILLN